MMKTSYDPDADAFAAWFAPEGVTSDRTDEVAPGMFVDFDAAGRPIGVEVLSVRSRVSGTYGALPKQTAAR